MGLFTNTLDISPTNLDATISGLPRYIVNKSFAFVSENGHTMTVPKGYISDLASFPWPFRNWFRPDDTRWAQAAVLHDYLCSVKKYPRRHADLYFFEAMQALKNPWHLRWAMYLSVKLRSVYLNLLG